MKKFELDYSSSTTYRGRTLYRIKALKDFVTTDGSLIHKDDLGGYVQSEANLDQRGASWIFKGAIAMDNSRVLNDAQLHNDALIKDKAVIECRASAHNNVTIAGHAHVSGQAVVTRNAQIKNHANVHGKAFITGNAIVSGYATITDKAQVHDHAIVSDNAFVAQNATVSDHAEISDYARILDNSQIEEKATICDFTRIEDDAKISDHATVCDHAIVKNKTYVSDDITISGYTILNLSETDHTIQSSKDYTTFKGFDDTHITFVTATQTWIQSNNNRRILFEGDTDKFIAHGYAHSNAWGDCYKAYATIVKKLEPKKFELTTKISFNGRTLYRIRALKDFGVVKKGDLGGYVEKESNLSQTGNAWIYDDAKVMDNAIVKDDATLHHNAEVYDKAIVSGSASINENAILRDKATVSDKAILYGNVILVDDAKIYDKARLYDYVLVSGNAQVYDNARCYGFAKIEDNTQVFNDAIIDNAVISGSACIFDKATVKNNATISGHVNLYGNITVFGQAYLTSDDDVMLRSNDDYMVVKHWSNNDMITYIKPSDHWHSPAFSSSTEHLKSYAKNRPNEHKILAYIDFVIKALK